MGTAATAQQTDKERMRGLPPAQLNQDSGPFVPDRMGVREAWAASPVHKRVAILRRARNRMAKMTQSFADAISPELCRTQADTLVAEVLPLLAACRFLETHAAKILTPRRLGLRGRPIWLAGVRSEVHRVPFGTVLVIGPANYPLLLPGVQALQALAAGNAVIWKPGRGGGRVAQLVAEALEESGLPPGILEVTEETIEAAHRVISSGIDKVFFTGSREVGRAILRELAESLTPSVMELSGCDAVIILPDADIDHVVKALSFGMRLNGSATCMAPRRVILTDPDLTRRRVLLERLEQELMTIPRVAVSQTTAQRLASLLLQASAAGAKVMREESGETIRPVIIVDAKSEMDLASADIFAPVLMIFEAKPADVEQLVNASPLALTVSIFGSVAEACKIADQVIAGTVLINDVIVPTADPRLPFGGRRQSGFGVTRGREGLLEMTAVKVISIRHGKSQKHFEPTGAEHAELFQGVIETTHSETWADRWRGFRRLLKAATEIRRAS